MTTHRVVLLAAAVALVVLAACAPRVTALPLPEGAVFAASREAVHQVIIDRLHEDGWVMTQSDAAGGFIAATQTVTVMERRGLLGSEAVRYTRRLSVTTSEVGNATRVLIQGGSSTNADYNEHVVPTAFAVMEDLTREFGRVQ